METVGSPGGAEGLDGAPDILFFDVSGDGCLEDDGRSGRLERELEELGFERLGWMQVRSIGGGNPYRGWDRAEHDRSLKREHKVRSPVFRSRDGFRVAFPERALGADYLLIQSLLEDGTVVRTHLRPSRLPELASGVNPDEGEESPTERTLDSLEKRALGDHFRLTNPDRPGSGIRELIVANQDAASVVAAHARLVDQLPARTVSVDMPLALAARRRCRHVCRVQHAFLRSLSPVLRALPLLSASAAVSGAASIAGADLRTSALLAIVMTATVLFSDLTVGIGAGCITGAGAVGFWLVRGGGLAPVIAGGIALGFLWFLAADFVVPGAELRLGNVVLRYLRSPRVVPASALRAAYPEPSRQ